MMPSRLDPWLPGSSPLLFDGAMGSRLLAIDPAATRPVDLLSLELPDLVRLVHRGYRDAGATVLTTNTFGANRFRLGSRAHLVEQLNRTSVRLAREEEGSCLVAGSVGPSGLKENLPNYEELRTGFREQAEALHSEGVDMFVCETFGDLGELMAAIAGIRDVSSLPLIALMTYGPTVRTASGHSPTQIAEALSRLPIDAIGVNCAVGDDTAELVVRELSAATNVPIAALPNAGKPLRNADGMRYPLEAEGFAALAVRLSSFASIVGGCCGTSAEHIAGARSALEQAKRPPGPH
jgi:methionine synthase / methylenetetrahydrofolate reductase(NADPH)